MPAPPSALVEAPADDRGRLGEALKARAEEVLERTVALTSGTGHDVEAVVQGSFERISRSSTIAVARWIAGESMEVAIEAGQETWLIFGELAAQRAASLDEVTRRCFWWRNVMAEVLRESATQLDVSPEALAQALNILQLSLEFSLLRMCECFETERQPHRRGAHAARGGALLPGHPRPADRPAQPDADPRPRRAVARALAAQPDARRRRCSSISTTSSRINDTLGHGVGDELLQAVAARLDGVIRGSDALGRLGGDEFVVISEDLSLEAGPELIAERLLDALKQPFKLGADKETRVTVTASIGIAIGERISAEELLRDADIAMYRAKWDGKNRHVVFESGMQDTVQNRMELEMDLREALENEEFFLAYQPTLDLSDMSPNGVEALIRWRHPVRGIVQPNDFIPLLEETGLIVEIGRWVLQEACRQGAAWRASWISDHDGRQRLRTPARHRSAGG